MTYTFQDGKFQLITSIKRGDVLVVPKVLTVTITDIEIMRIAGETKAKVHFVQTKEGDAAEYVDSQYLTDLAGFFDRFSKGLSPVN